MSADSLKALGQEKHQALIVNRVDAESGKAAGLSRSKLHLSRWAEGYEQGQGRIRCSRRVTNNASSGCRIGWPSGSPRSARTGSGYSAGEGKKLGDRRRE